MNEALSVLNEIQKKVKSLVHQANDIPMEIFKEITLLDAQVTSTITKIEKKLSRGNGS